MLSLANTPRMTMEVSTMQSHIDSRGAVRSAASSYAAMRTVAGSRPVLVIG